jgi:hypothetical protein
MKTKTSASDAAAKADLLCAQTCTTIYPRKSRQKI